MGLSLLREGTYARANEIIRLHMLKLLTYPERKYTTDTGVPSETMVVRASVNFFRKKSEN